ncbi:DNA-processing protein DprA [Azonexus sp.]|uniref:DNA-processing protein DprA n=1 Tax=Azonexus sp. TaxID=1872668 RepID=UPI0039E5D611
MKTDSGLAAWLRLTLTPGIGGESQRRLLAAWGLPEAIFTRSAADLHAVIGQRANQLLNDPPQAAIDAALAWAELPGHRILTLADADYPQMLLDTPDPPSVLYVLGEPRHLNQSSLGVVGSRNATPQGLRNAEEFSAALAGRGWQIVSGMALGIDTAAHQGALRAGGVTVAVIGTGIDRVYPARNHDLARRIAAQGAIVSEFALGTPAMAGNFPRRNRLIAGLSRGVLVIEAAVESGSLITARLAGELGREVFAIPGSIHSPQARGCHRLIRDGAKLVETAEHIEEELRPVCGFSTPVCRRAEAIHNGADGLSAVVPDVVVDTSAESGLLALIGFDSVSLDELVAASGQTTETLLAALLELELSGQIAPLPGNRYQRLL